MLDVPLVCLPVAIESYCVFLTILSEHANQEESKICT